ncbi:MAG: hypothetical protein V4475_08580 [Pseudomonadota bacterium]
MSTPKATGVGGCPRCNSVDWYVRDSVGMLETWRCDSCELEQLVHVHRVPNPLPQPSGAVFELMGQSHERISPAQAREISEAFFALRNTPPQVVVARARKGQLLLGLFNDREVSDVEAKLSRFRMSVQKGRVRSI